MITVGFIGAGNMGSALARAAAKAEDTEIYIYDTDVAKAMELAGELSAVAASFEKTAEADLVFLAVKPNVVKDVAGECRRCLKPGAAVVSMAAGVTIDSLALALDGIPSSPATPIIRIMPNTPAACGSGMMVYSKNGAVTDGMLARFKKVMAPSGTIDELPERLIDAASALSGCGPAYVYMFIEALADGAVACGLPRDKALSYAIETVKGSAEMVKASGEHPEALKDKVCSPGGSTIMGVHELEKGGFRATVESAIISAYKKTASLGK